MQGSIYMIDLKNIYLTCRKIYEKIFGCNWSLVVIDAFNSF